MEEAKAYFIELKTRIESVEGYNNDMCIVYTGDINNKKNNNLYKMVEYQDISIIPFIGNLGDWVSNNHLYSFMKIWTGYEPNICWDEEVINSINTDNMPHYPDDGSIRVTDGMVVVNF